jgi:hypothetical protein
MPAKKPADVRIRDFKQAPYATIGHAETLHFLWPILQSTSAATPSTSSTKRPGHTAGDDLSLFFQAEYQFSSAHRDFINDTLNGSNLRMTSPTALTTITTA